MRVSAVALVVAVVASIRAHAGGQIGVVSGGDPTMQKRVTAHVEKWLEKQGNKLVSTPLSKDAANTLANCFVLDDLKCARGVVDARTKSISLVYVGVDVDGKTMTFTLYWFVKGREPTGQKQTCEACTEQKWHVLVDSVLQRLSDETTVEMGKLALESEPAGLMVVLDDVKIGPTPIERDLPAGKHTITLTHRGKSVATREIEIAIGETNSVSMNVDLVPTEKPSKLAPTLVIAAGVVAATAGSILVWQGSKDDPSEKWIYPSFVPGGIALCVVGGGAIIGGGILLLRASWSQSAPVVAAGPGGAYLGWVSRF